MPIARRLTDAEAEARWQQAEKQTEPDDNDSHLGYHCERCTARLDYGEEVNKDGHILCKDCAKKDD